MSMRSFGWAAVVLGLLMAGAGLVSVAPVALFVAWIGIILLVLGFLSLVLNRLEGPPIDERWRLRRRAH